MDILSRIINYESEVFNEYLSKRQKLLDNIAKIEIHKLNKKQLKVFVHDIKSIIEPIKTSISEIDYYFTNTDFKKTESIEQFKQLKQLVLYYFLLNQSDTEEIDISLSSSESTSESVSEL